MVETADEKPPEVVANTHRNGTLIKLTAVILILGLAWLLYWVFYLQYYEYTDDAYANGNMININAAVSGSVVAYYADDTDFVSEGQLLVQLDDTNYRLHYEKELATLASVVLQVRQLYDNVEAAKALLESKRTALVKATYDFDNRSKLISSKAVSNEDYMHARDNKQIADADFKQAEAQLLVALDAAGNTPLEAHPLIEKQKATIRSAYYNLQHCTIYAPSSGYVAQRAVEVGQWVGTMTSLMAVIPIDYVWVDANFKETQLTYMRIGQPATVWFDLYGSHVQFKGKVLGIASGTGSVFSIIPPQNATGNWIKIVQRLPVRISLDAKDLQKYPPRLGISAEVDVDITNQDLPYLAGKVPVRPIAKTMVYDLNFESVDKHMAGVISGNMQPKES